jgi:uncharacterized protein with GYD domain
MIRVVSLVRLTDEGMRQLSGLGDIVASVRETVTGVGGTLEQAWATAGAYDFIAVLCFPDLDAEFRARNAVYKIGLLRAEHMPALPMDQAIPLAAGADS